MALLLVSTDRICIDWQRAVTGSLFGLCYFIFVVAWAVYLFRRL
jgi:hypothetical protein